MCEYVGQAMAHALSRRGFLQRAGVVGAAAGVAGIAPVASASARGPTHSGSPRQRLDKAAAKRFRTRLVLLGTAGGPSWFTPARKGIASAVVVGDAVYLVDCGDGLGPRLFEALDATPRQTLAPVRATFVTHLHSDHTIDYPDLPVLGMWNGLTDPARKLHVFGPGNRGALPPVFPPTRPTPPVISPEDPTPGIEGMTDYILKAWATDLNDRLRDSGGTDPRSVLVVKDIDLPAGVSGPVDTNPMPPVAPFLVFEDDNVKVTATLVNHAPVFPSFGFRFDTADGSITFSGDTAPSDNLVKLAEDTDILVHEVIDADWVNAIFPPPRTPEVEGLVAHLIGSHTTIEQVGPVAERAGARKLVLNHFVPADNPPERWAAAKRGFSGRLIVGEDLQHIGVGKARRAKKARAG
jgi:ribonuclease BN (tRNA processing enzyme)